jgi:hypothetical protein
VTAPVEPWRPEPGTVWAGRSGSLWLVLPSGLMAVLGDDDPGAGTDPDEAWGQDGPLHPHTGGTTVDRDDQDAVSAWLGWLDGRRLAVLP